MRIDDKVNLYFPATGERVTATIVKISGMGKSLCKTLDLQYKEGEEDVKLTAVPHREDAVAGETFWLQKGTPAPKGWAEEEPAEDVVPVEPEPLKKPKSRKR